jgi:hypothetical protein
VQAQLGAGFSAPAPSSSAAAFYTPSETLRSPSAAPAGKRSRKVEPARPRTYFRWRDDRGLTHVAEAPPPEGTVYSTIRALD